MTSGSHRVTGPSETGGHVLRLHAYVIVCVPGASLLSTGKSILKHQHQPIRTVCPGWDRETIVSACHWQQLNDSTTMESIYHSSVNLLNCNYSLLWPIYCLLHTLCIDFIFFYCVIDLFIVLLACLSFIPCVTLCCCLCHTALLYSWPGRICK